MSKDEVVGLVAGLLLGLVMLISYPMAGLYLLSLLLVIVILFSFTGAIPLGLYIFVKSIKLFKYTESSDHFMDCVIGIDLIVMGFLSWATLIGWY